VGILGIGIQLATLAALHGWAGLHYLPATALAVESAVLHNFAWHEHWTWADRPSRTLRESLARLIRFNLTNGAISIGSNLLLMSLLVDGLGIPYLPANLLAITLCSIVNFLASDRYVFKMNGRTVNPREGCLDREQAQGGETHA
jgi:putative flippase GtrA